MRVLFTLLLICFTTFTFADKTITVDLTSKNVTFKNEKFYCVIGSKKYPTPTGTYKAYRLLLNPIWYPPLSSWAVSRNIAVPGVNNPLGVGCIVLGGTDILLHGGADAKDLRKGVSHGCIRIPNYQFLKVADYIVDNWNEHSWYVTRNIVCISIPLRGVTVVIK